MLIAEIHGLYVPEARNSEDYLTSAVFGHLRYIQPGAFWDGLFDFAISQPIGLKTISAAEHIRQETDSSLSSFARLDVIFWPEHKKEGIPDLVLYFSGDQPRPVVILIEAKLHATKSGIGEHDQLARYLRILDSLGDLRPPLPSNAVTLAIYLTTIDSRNEVLESLQEYGDDLVSRSRLYQLRWQDLIRAVDQAQPSSAIERLVLNDVRSFLRARDLEYFGGMENADNIPAVSQSDGDFLMGEPLFDPDSLPSGLDVINERWMHAD